MRREGELQLTSGLDGLTAVDAESGEKRWSFEDEDAENWYLAAARDRLVVMNSTSLMAFPAL